MTSGEILFEPEVHRYTRRDGRLIPSVTQILRAVGVTVDFDALRHQSTDLAAAIDQKRHIGTVVHSDSHALDDGDLDWATVDPVIDPYLRAWEAFRDNTRLVPHVRERIVYHPELAYCGTLDGIFVSPTGRLVLVDLKVGDPRDAAAHLQTAAYSQAWDHEHPNEPIAERWAVQLTPENTVPYRMTPYTDWRDVGKFNACLTVYYEQPGRRKRAA